MKILHLLPPGFGGVDAYVFNHYKYMDWNQFRFDFMTTYAGFQDAPQYKKYPHTVNILPLAGGKKQDDFICTVRTILENQYDAVHLHTSFWTGTLIEEIAKDMGVPRVIVHAHSSYAEEKNDEKRRRFLERHEAIKQSFEVDLATDYWACSRKAADWLFGEQISRERIIIMKNAIEVDKYRFNSQTRASVREKLGIGDAVVLGTVGRIAYSKNHSFLVDMFAEFYKTHHNAKLLIIGDGELREELQAQICDKHLEEAVLLLGWVTDVEYYLQAMDCFLLPSRFEGLGIAAVEAVASGLPCIVSEHLPEELASIPNIQYVPLHIEDWISATSTTLENRPERTRGVDAVRTAGYDVRQQAKVLERIYKAQ